VKTRTTRRKRLDERPKPLTTTADVMAQWVRDARQRAEKIRAAHAHAGVRT
jgi:hypothetical protein